jgi:hypothetical protein
MELKDLNDHKNVVAHAISTSTSTSTPKPQTKEIRAKSISEIFQTLGVKK